MELGYYWILVDDRWTVAQYLGNGFWECSGFDDVGLTDFDIQKIGPRIELPNECKT